MSPRETMRLTFASSGSVSVMADRSPRGWKQRVKDTHWVMSFDEGRYEIVSTSSASMVPGETAAGSLSDLERSVHSSGEMPLKVTK